MPDDLIEAQRFRRLAEEMESLARSESNEARWAELRGLADQYRKLAAEVAKRSSEGLRPPL